MPKTKKTPNLRFPEFTADWEQRKLGEIGETFTGLSGKTKDDFGKGTAKYITYMNVFSNSVSSLDGVDLIEIDDKQNQVKYGDVLFTTSSETPNEVGMSSVWLGTAKNIYLNSFCFGYRPLEPVDPYYLGTVLRSPSVRARFILLAQGVSRYNISKVKAMDIAISLPSLEEQARIGAFFQEFDNLIAIHQRKLEALKEQKKGLLQQMFPKDGADIPELRFPEFTGAWEQRKLGEVAEIIGGGTPSTTEPEYWDGTIDWYSPTEIGASIYAYGSVKKITQLGLEKSSAKILPKDKTILFTSRAGIGDMAILKREGATNQGFQSLVVNEGHDTYFVYSMGGIIKKYALKNASGSTFLEISGKTLRDMNCFMPSFEEQTRIGSFFQEFDNLIVIHQRKLEALQEQKKGLLQQMFV